MESGDLPKGEGHFSGDITTRSGFSNLLLGRVTGAALRMTAFPSGLGSASMALPQNGGIHRVGKTADILRRDATLLYV